MDGLQHGRRLGFRIFVCQLVSRDSFLSG